MKRVVILCCGFVAMAAALMGQSQRGDLPVAWKHWPYSALIAGPATGGDGLWSVVIPSRVSAKSVGDLADVRVIDATGDEVPFVVHTRKEKRTTTLRPGRLFDASFKPGESTQGVVDLGAQAGEHNSMVIETSERNYFTHVEVSMSNDARDWRLLRDRAPVYRFASEGLDGNQTVRYPASRARYLRLRVLQSEKQFPLDGVRVAQEMVEEAETAAIEAVLTRDPNSPAQHSWWSRDLGHGNDPISSVRFQVDRAEFHRAVRIRTSVTPENPRSWYSAGEGDIYRYRRGEQLYEKLVITFPETRARYWRVEIFNRNDPELTGLNLALYHTPRRVIFSGQAGATRRLLYGNKAASAASYEMARLTEKVLLEAAAQAKLGPEEANPSYEDPHPLPWTERNPFVLWGVVLLAVAVLGALAVRALRTS